MLHSKTLLSAAAIMAVMTAAPMAWAQGSAAGQDPAANAPAAGSPSGSTAGSPYGSSAGSASATANDATSATASSAKKAHKHKSSGMTDKSGQMAQPDASQQASPPPQQ